MKPRNTLFETRAHGQIRREFFSRYIRAYAVGGGDDEIGDSTAIFEPAFLQILRTQLSEHALETEVVLTDLLTNRRFAVMITMKNEQRVIAVNARFKADPEMLAHALVEEYAHAQQVLDRVDFEEQRRQYPDYNDRPYEQQAKQLATDLLGYPLDDYDVYIRRNEPDGTLYDRVNPTDPSD